jgi:nitrite reductase/ring-hydroxylating ferredoxin subunit
MKDCNDNGACMNRREFLVKTGIVAGGVMLTVSAFGGSVLGRAFEDVNVPIGADSPLAKVGGSQVVDTSAGKVLVIQIDKGNYVAFSAKCTHKGATLGYNAETKQIACPSHGSKFDTTDGHKLGGPAPADVNLQKFATKSTDKAVTVTVGS